MRHERIRDRAQLLDSIVRTYKKARGGKYFPHRVVEQVMPILFPRSRKIGRGAFKTVYRVESPARFVALKVTASKHVRRDRKLYEGIPVGVRNRYFAKIYWYTKYCLLQKYGREVNVPKNVLKRLQERGRRFGLSDVRRDNIRRVEGHFKIVDANPR